MVAHPEGQSCWCWTYGGCCDDRWYSLWTGWWLKKQSWQIWVRQWEGLSHIEKNHVPNQPVDHYGSFRSPNPYVQHQQALCTNPNSPTSVIGTVHQAGACRVARQCFWTTSTLLHALGNTAPAQKHKTLSACGWHCSVSDLWWFVILQHLVSHRILSVLCVALLLCLSFLMFAFLSLNLHSHHKSFCSSNSHSGRKAMDRTQQNIPRCCDLACGGCVAVDGIGLV